MRRVGGRGSDAGAVVSDLRLTPEEQEQWDGFVEQFRREQVAGISESAMFMSIVPDDEGDVQFWAQLGCAIMLDKPILAVAIRGRDVPPKLRLIADKVVRADIDTEDGKQAILGALHTLTNEQASAGRSSGEAASADRERGA